MEVVIGVIAFVFVFNIASFFTMNSEDSEKINELFSNNEQIVYEYSKPKLKDFGVSEKDLRFSERFEKQIEAKILRRRIILYLMIGAVFIMFNLNVSEKNIWAVIVLDIIYLIPISFADTILGLLVLQPLFGGGLGNLLKEIIRVGNSKSFKRLENVELAKKQFNCDLKKWEVKENERKEKERLAKIEEEEQRRCQEEERKKKEKEEFRRKENYWLSLSGYEFEDEIAELYRKQGYIAQTTSYSGDGGVDIVMTDAEGIQIYVQCKNHKNPVGVAVIRELYGVMMSDGVEEGVLVCSGGFTGGVFEFAKDKAIELVDMRKVVEMANGGDYSSLMKKGKDGEYYLDIEYSTKEVADKQRHYLSRKYENFNWIVRAERENKEEFALTKYKVFAIESMDESPIEQYENLLLKGCDEDLVREEMSFEAAELKREAEQLRKNSEQLSLDERFLAKKQAKELEQKAQEYERLGKGEDEDVIKIRKKVENSRVLRKVLLGKGYNREEVESILRGEGIQKESDV